MKKGEIWYGTFWYISDTKGRSKATVKKSYVTSFVVGKEDTSWARIKFRDKLFKKEINIEPIKKIGNTNQRL